MNRTQLKFPFLPLPRVPFLQACKGWRFYPLPMPDLLVKLYELPPLEPFLERARQNGIEVRRALAPEKHVVGDWVETRFSRAWRSEAEVAFSCAPVSIFIAVKDNACAGFCCYDATLRGFYGPVGVDATLRKSGIGAALSLATLHAMRSVGYGYAIIGGAGPVEFYSRICGATVIEGSWPGVYAGLLRAPSSSS